MTDSIEKIVWRGYQTWKKNMVLGAPLLINMVAIFMLWFIAAFLFIGGIIASYVLEMGFFASVLILCLFLVLMALLTVLISSYFSAAAIGMAQKAAFGMEAKLGDILTYGKRKVKDLFIARLIIAAIYLVIGAVFIAVFAAGLLFEAINLSLFSVALGSAAMFSTTFVLYFVLSPLDYAIVLSGLDAAEGIKKSYLFVRKNLVSVLLLLFTIEGTAFIAGVALELIVNLIGLIPILGAFIGLGVYVLYGLFALAVMQPIFILWWVFLYASLENITSASLEETPREPDTLIEERIYI